MTDKM